MIDSSRVESPQVVTAAGVLRAAQFGLMDAERKYWLAQQAYEATVLDKSSPDEGIAAMFAYDLAILDRATALEECAIARVAYKAARDGVAA